MDLFIFKFEVFLSILKKILPIFFITLLIVESIYLIYSLKQFNKKETFVNLATGAISIIAQSFIKILFFTELYPSVYEHKIFDISLGWHQVVIAFFIYTFLQWLIHYLSHKVRFFWCLHEVHHSATHMNITTGLRTSIFDIISLEMLYLLIPFLGFHYIFYFLFYTVNKFWGSFIHINEKLVSQVPVLKYILVTPAAHHIHHASNIPYLDKNYGELIPWYDYLFKTYAKENEQPIQYGTLKITTEIGFWQSQTHEFKQLWQDVVTTKKWHHKMLYFIMPPGWHPGSFEQTAKQIQKKYYEIEPKTTPLKN
jgi:sterol desaturase/sphingolipid hydroxylase (fatty acid hydroxylase superfamily)